MEIKEEKPPADASLYRNGISIMMHGFGDNCNPLPETVRLVEQIVIKQIFELLYEASNYVQKMNLQLIDAKEIVFTLRHDRHKMQRLVKYLDYKIQNTAFAGNVNNIEVLSNASEKESIKKYRRLREYIESIDETGELTDVEEFDTVKYDRAVRAELLSSALDKAQYKKYTQAKQLSFFSKKFAQPANFRSWIDPLHYFNLSPLAIEILELIAFNIIGHLVDLSLIIRQNNKRRSENPLKKLPGTCYNSTMFNAPHFPNNKVTLDQAPITSREIHEVVRRCYNPQVGYLPFSNKSILGKRKRTLY